jgi:hydrogenase expression/formation protein HypE
MRTSKIDKISLGHGSGGKLTAELIEKLFLPYLKNPLLSPLDDSAVFSIDDKKIAFTTDSFTVYPLIFPGGDLGKLATAGTINDLVVSGAKPLFLSAGFIIEEGLEGDTLERIVKSMAEVAEISGVKIVAGDTKVVERGKGDGIYINTSGIGILYRGVNLSIERILPGDKILINGSVGDHGASVIMARGEFNIEGDIESDCAPLNLLLNEILSKLPHTIKFMRDPTRGGIATALNEMAEKSGFDFLIYEERVPVNPKVKSFCELLGFDPYYLANEGKVIMVVDPDYAEEILSLLKSNPLGEKSSIIGEVLDSKEGNVYLETEVGGTRILDILIEDQFPRIC